MVAFDEKALDNIVLSQLKGRSNKKLVDTMLKKIQHVHESKAERVSNGKRL